MVKIVYVNHLETNCKFLNARCYRILQLRILTGYTRRHISCAYQSCYRQQFSVCRLTHWGRVTHICVSKLAIIASDNGVSPGRRQAIICTNAGILLFGPLGINFSGILSGIHTYSYKKMRLKMSSGKWWPSCLGLNVLTIQQFIRECIDCAIPSTLYDTSSTLRIWSHLIIFSSRDDVIASICISCTETFKKGQNHKCQYKNMHMKYM